ncbi:MAG: L,D-transpeptidase [Gammaproteobacteria bacterium]|nr:L,D-transpeptidase [Gammaproteobacteria bacterium]
MNIRISIPRQRLVLLREGSVVSEYAVSTALSGTGERNGSGCTPRGRHLVRARIGAGSQLNTVFVARRPTGELYSSVLARAHPGRDWILTRIIWLSGLERGRNRLGEVDTFRRFIYVHGTPDGEPMGIPRSHGCIRMRNRDIVELFDLVPVGTEVFINEKEGW